MKEVFGDVVRCDRKKSDFGGLYLVGESSNESNGSRNARIWPGKTI